MTASSAPDKGVILAQCRGAAERRLEQVLDPLLDAAAELLTQLGGNAQDMRDREQFYGSAARLRNQRAEYYAGFRKGFGERFDAAARALMKRGPGWEELDRETAAMLRTNVLENEVAIIKLGVRLKEAAKDDLAGLSARVAAVFRVRDLDDGENPLGPAAVAHGVYAGLVAARVEGHAARALRPLLEERLSSPVRDLYRALNEALDKLGVRPQAAASASASASPTAAAKASPALAAAAQTAPPTSAPAATPAAAPSGPAISLAGETAAARRVAAVIRARAAPEALLPFLRQTWVRVLAIAYDAGGEQGEAWQRDVRTLEELMWSIAPKPDAASRARLRGLIPELLKRIDAGMARLALGEAERREARDALMAIHRALLQEPVR